MKFSRVGLVAHGRGNPQWFSIDQSVIEKKGEEKQDFGLRDFRFVTC